MAKARKLARDATDVVREEEVGLEFNTGTSIDSGAEKTSGRRAKLRTRCYQYHCHYNLEEMTMLRDVKAPVETIDESESMKKMLRKRLRVTTPS